MPFTQRIKPYEGLAEARPAEATDLRYPYLFRVKSSPAMSSCTGASDTRLPRCGDSAEESATYLHGA